MSAPAVTLTPEAAAYVRERGGALTLRRTPRHGCCGGTVALAIAEAGTPPDDADFAHRVLDAPGGPITLFTDPGLDGLLRVGLDRLFGLASLYVEGAEAAI